jgi:hypothetical protein
VKGRRIGPGLIQTEAFDLPADQPEPKRRVAAMPPEPGTWAATKADAERAGRAIGRLFGGAFKEGMRRGLDPKHRWRDPVTGRFVQRR